MVVEAGPVTFDSSQTDKNKMPNWNVGNWDNNASPPVSTSLGQTVSVILTSYFRLGDWTHSGHVRR